MTKSKWPLQFEVPLSEPAGGRRRDGGADSKPAVHSNIVSVTVHGAGRVIVASHLNKWPM